MRVLIVLVMSMWAAGAFAQSLGEIARQEAERRKTVKAPAKVYTNDLLKAEPLPSTAPAPPGAAPDAVAPGVPAAGPPAPPGGAQPGPGVPQAGSASQTPKDEAAWRARLQGARDSLSRTQLFADALQSRINGLSADFTARDDPAQRATVAAERQRALDELERVKKDLQLQTKALTDVQEEGRRAGVPAGWLR